MALVLPGSAGTAMAQTNLVQNGNFSSLLVNASDQFGSLYPTQQVTGWSTGGYNFVFLPGTADTTGATGASGNVKLWGPNDGSSNGLTAASPTGGNYIAADGAYEVSAITQTINGLNVGQNVTVSFSWAGAQQSGFTGATSDYWTVSLGTVSASNPSQTTSTVNLASKGFSGWMSQTFTFVATSSSELLSFLATGTPSGQPPFALLANVSVTNVPEPAAWTVMVSGLVGLIG
ncbi:MAG: hypothetical protein P4L90_30010, partial [Rhodopila sp.]|nr:hypothetical protein [Rhodopila sp.]